MARRQPKQNSPRFGFLFKLKLSLLILGICFFVGVVTGIIDLLS